MSRPHLFMLSILICLMAVSCSPAEGDASAVASRLSDAEHILFNNPDSAKTLLLQMPVPSSSQPREHALWALLLTHARYKCFETQNDSLANIAYDYFMKTDDALHRAQTLYMKGVLCGEARQTDEEQKYLLQADLEVAKTDNNELGYVINIALSIGYAYRSLYDYALETCGKALRYAEATGKPEFIAFSNIQYGRIYGDRAQKTGSHDDYISSIHYYQNAIDLAKEYGSKPILANAMQEQAAVYVDIEEYKLALQLAKDALSLYTMIGKSDLSTSYLSLGTAFCRLGEKDSAVFYLNKALNTDNIYTLRTVNQTLCSINQDSKNYEAALCYSTKVLQLKDSIQELERNRDITEMREKYNQQKILLEKRQLEIEHERVLHAALLGLLIFIILLAVIVYRYQRKLIRKERRLRESEEKLRQDTLKIEQNNAVIADNRRRIEELTLLMEADKDTHRQQADEHRQVVQYLNDEIVALQTENEHLRQSAGQVEQGSGAVSAETVQQLRAQLDASRALLVMRTSTLASLIASPRFVDDAEFEKVKEEVDGIFDGYSRRLSEAFPLLTERDIHVALLIKLHLPNKSMAVIMAVSPTTVTKQKQRLKEHITQVVGDLGEGQTLETWLWEF